MLWLIHTQRIKASGQHFLGSIFEKTKLAQCLDGLQGYFLNDLFDYLLYFTVSGRFDVDKFRWQLTITAI